MPDSKSPATNHVKEMLGTFHQGFVQAMDDDRADVEAAPKVHRVERGEYVEEAVDPAGDMGHADAAPATSGKVLTSLMSAKDLDTKEKRTAYADQLGEEVLEHVQAIRKSKGLPPLPRVAPKV